MLLTQTAHEMRCSVGKRIHRSVVPVVTGPGSFRKGKKCQSLSRDREDFHGAPNDWVLQSGGRSQQLEFGKSKIRMRLEPGARRKGRWQDLSHPDSLCLRSS